MKNNVVKHTRQEIIELLESDDELPDSYVETPIIPAYLDDNRFSKPEKDKNELSHEPEEDSTQIQRDNQHSIAENTTESTCAEHNLLDTSSLLSEHEPLDDGKILISKGVLTKRDLFLIKSIEEYSTDTTLLWLIDFMCHKAIKPLQRSCLVGDIITDKFVATKDPFEDFNMRYYLKLVVN